MERMKKENKLEQLLNSLIEKGWKPFGESRIDEINRAEQYAGNWNWCCWGSKDAIQKRKSTRQIVSRESGLWQFCIKNGLIEVDDHIPTLWEKRYKAPGVESIYKNDIHFEKEFEYRLIESALCNEEDLEKFLLDNIKL